MIRRFVFILILTAVALQGAFVSGGAQSIAICLGGGHEHTPEEVVADCGHQSCTHDTGFPAPVPLEDDDDRHCGCTDIELALIDLLTTPRGTDDNGGTVIATLNFDVALSPVHFDHAARHQIYDRRSDDPGGRLRCAALRTTHILI